MVKVSIEVRSGPSRFEVAVSAGSLRRALSIAGGQHSGRPAGVKLPIGPKGLFSGDPAAQAGRVERPKTAA